MKKLYFLWFALIALSACSPKTSGGISREITGAEFDKLIRFLVAEDWNEAFRLAEEYLPPNAKNDTGGESARLRYMYIYALAGRIGERSIGREEGLKKAKKLEGLRVEMPSHPLRPTSECMFNCFWTAENDPMKISVTSSGKAGTFIHAFETFEMPKGLDVENNRGKTLRLGGTLAKIELRGQMLAAFGIDVKDCYFEVEDE